MGQFTIEVKGLREAEIALENIKGGAAKAITRTLNKTVRVVKTDAAKEVTKDFNVSQTTAKRDMKVFTANYSNLNAALRTRGKVVPLGKTLRYRQTRKGVSVLVFKRKKRKHIPKAFLLRKGNFRGIFRRVWRGEKSENPLQKKGYYAKLPKKYRYPIEQLFGPRIPDILGDPRAMKPVLKKAGERLEKNLSHEVEFVLEFAK